MITEFKPCNHCHKKGWYLIKHPNDGRCKYCGKASRWRGYRRPFVPKNKTNISDAEISCIKNNFHQLTNKELLHQLNKNRSAEKQIGFTVLRKLTRALQMRHVKAQRKWTRKEERCMKAWMPLMGDVQISERLNQLVSDGTRIFNRKNVKKKRKLMNLHRTPEQIKRICKDNQLCGSGSGFDLGRGKKYLKLKKQPDPIITARIPSGSLIIIRRKNKSSTRRSGEMISNEEFQKRFAKTALRYSNKKNPPVEMAQALQY